MSDEFERLAQRIDRRAVNLATNADKVVKETFLAVSTDVVQHTPLWSGQARLNWTAEVSQAKPATRRVNVPRKNNRIKKGRLMDAGSGSFGDIEVDTNVSSTAAPVALAAIREMADRYRHPIRPSSFFGRSPNQFRKGARTPRFYLSNSLPYIAKLWSGTWPSNPRTLASQLDAGKRIVSKYRGKMLNGS